MYRGGDKVYFVPVLEGIQCLFLFCQYVWRIDTKFVHPSKRQLPFYKRRKSDRLHMQAYHHMYLATQNIRIKGK